MQKLQLFIILLFGSILMFTADLYAQSYTPFFLEDVEWAMFTPFPVIGPGDGGKVWKNNTRSDTMVNGLSYKNLTETQLCRWWPDQNGDPIYQNIDNTEKLIGGLREENRIVYFLDYQEEEEIVLYDFNIEVGDTSWYSPDDYLIILSKDDSSGSTTFYEVLNSNGYGFPNIPSRLTEGIGSSYGLFGVYTGGFDRLACFGTEGQITNGDCQVCEGFITAIDDVEPSPIMVYPNPGRDIIRVQSMEGVNSIQLFDPNGKCVLREDDFVESIDVRGLPGGVYTYEINLEGGKRYVGKIVKEPY